MASADRLIEVFNEAKARPVGAERDHFLSEVCRNEPELKEQVLSLLKAHEGAGDFLEHTQVIPPVTVLTEKPGDKIGRYKLLQKIGEGGCGVVYMAEQEEPARRRVAFKVIKLGMDTKQVVARFEAEVQALALMDHPNIAKVFDAGATNTGRPYFVMELVRGIKITEYCDQNNLPTKERLKLFTQVCNAIQHAHQKGIIHRDIKPSNILVTVNDGVPVPKVIDFGIAKAIEQRLTDKTVFTAFEQFIGTPAYMSPEQAEMTSLDIDTRADIYSLGVLLYELLSGNTPFDAQTLLASGIAEIRRIIREQEPPKPSTRLNTLSNSDLSTVAACRHTDSPKLMHLIRGDLDWIVMKCLEKDRTRRYETANGLATDLQRHLDNEPVLARPPTHLYRFQKLVRRNKLGFAAGATIALLLVMGTTVSTWQALRATRAKAAALAEKQRADHQATVAGRVTEYMQQMLNTANPEASKGPDYKVREMLDDFARTIETQPADQPEAVATLHATIGNAYSNLLEYEKAKHHLGRALELRRGVFGQQHEKYADSLVDYAVLYGQQTQSELDESEAKIRKALGIYRASGIEGQRVVHALWALQFILDVGHRYESMEAVVNEAIAEARKSPRATYWEMTAIKHGLINAKISEGNFAEAERIGRETIATSIQLYGSNCTQLIWTGMIFNGALVHQRKFAEAMVVAKKSLAIVRERVAPDHPWFGHALNSVLQTLIAARDSLALTNLVSSPEQLSEMESWFREKLTARPRLPEEYFDPVNVAGQAIAQFPSLYLELADELSNDDATQAVAQCRQKAEALFQEILAMQQTTLSNNNAVVITTLLNLAGFLKAQGKANEGEKYYREALAIASNLNADVKSANALNSLSWDLVTADNPSSENTALAVVLAQKAVAATNRKNPMILDTLAATYAAAGQFTNAAGVQREAIALLQDEKQKADYIVRQKLYELNLAYRNHGRLAERTSALLAKGKFAEAEALARECLNIRAIIIPDNWRTFNACSMLGECLLGQKKYAEAEPLLLSGYEGMRQWEDKIPANRKGRLREGLQYLVQLYETTGQSEKAAEWNKTLAEFDKAETEKKAAAVKP